MLMLMFFFVNVSDAAVKWITRHHQGIGLECLRKNDCELFAPVAGNPIERSYAVLHDPRELAQ